MKNKLITRKQLAEELQVTTRTISNWQNKGLPFLKVGKRTVRFHYDQVIAWLVHGN